MCFEIRFSQEKVIIIKSMLIGLQITSLAMLNLKIFQCVKFTEVIYLILSSTILDTGISGKT